VYLRVYTDDNKGLIGHNSKVVINSKPLSQGAQNVSKYCSRPKFPL